VASDKSWNNLKRSLKAITKKTAPSTFDQRVAKLKEIYRGWINYFRMVTTITLKRLIKRGYEDMLNYYLTVSPQLNEPLYTRPVREGGVRGVPRQLQLARPSTRLAAGHLTQFTINKSKLDR
jgi:hypothetical protein